MTAGRLGSKRRDGYTPKPLENYRPAVSFFEREKAYNPDFYRPEDGKKHSDEWHAKGDRSRRFLYFNGLAKAVKEARKRAGLTVPALAEKIGVPGSFLGNAERADMSRVALAKMQTTPIIMAAKALGVDFEKFKEVTASADEKMEMVRIGAGLRESRELLGMSSVMASEKSGVSVTTILKTERGEVNRNFHKNARAMAAVYRRMQDDKDKDL